jgi:hypothetical protein
MPSAYVKQGVKYLHATSLNFCNESHARTIPVTKCGLSNPMFENGPAPGPPEQGLPSGEPLQVPIDQDFGGAASRQS